MFYVHYDMGREPLPLVFSGEAEVAQKAARFPGLIYFAVCELVAGKGWDHALPYTESLPHGAVISGCHACGVRLID